MTSGWGSSYTAHVWMSLGSGYYRDPQLSVVRGRLYKIEDCLCGITPCMCLPGICRVLLCKQVGIYSRCCGAHCGAVCSPGGQACMWPAPPHTRTKPCASRAAWHACLCRTQLSCTPVVILREVQFCVDAAVTFASCMRGSVRLAVACLHGHMLSLQRQQSLVMTPQAVTVCQEAGLPHGRSPMLK